MSVGQMLNQARVARGMSLEDLAQATKLRASILAAMEEAGVGPERTVMVGDTTFDVEMALAAGLPVINSKQDPFPGAEERKEKLGF